MDWALAILLGFVGFPIACAVGIIMILIVFRILCNFPLWKSI